ncbi:MAG: hypothetical protein ABEJ24_03885 [Candidatus Magasanikbacteria bacterium]
MPKKQDENKEEIKQAAEKVEDRVLEEKEPEKDKFIKSKNNSNKKIWLWGLVGLFVISVLGIWTWNLRTRFLDFQRNTETSELNEIQGKNGITQELEAIRNKIEASRQTTETNTNSNKKNNFANQLSKALATTTTKNTTSTTSTNKNKKQTNNNSTSTNN